VYVTPAAATKLADLPGGEATFRWRSAVPDSEDVSNPVDAVADGGFWAAVREASERGTLLCERWAYGNCGCRWFRVTPENAMEIAGLVWPGSLVCLITEPDCQTGPDVLADDFTAFADPTLPGELIYRSYPGGVDSTSDVAAGFSFVLADKVLTNWCAVVPDSDGAQDRPTTVNPAGSGHVRRLRSGSMALMRRVVDSIAFHLFVGLGVGVVLPGLILRWYGLVPGLVAFVVMFLVNQGLYRALYGNREGAAAARRTER
jgi:hypothetical protein